MKRHELIELLEKTKELCLEEGEFDEEEIQVFVEIAVNVYEDWY